MGERQRRRFNREFKLEAVRLLAERGNRVSEVARIWSSLSCRADPRPSDATQAGPYSDN